jgi:hypothetical protein
VLNQSKIFLRLEKSLIGSECIYNLSGDIISRIIDPSCVPTSIGDGKLINSKHLLIKEEIDITKRLDILKTRSLSIKTDISKNLKPILINQAKTKSKISLYKVFHEKNFFKILVLFCLKTLKIKNKHTTKKLNKTPNRKKR